MADITLDRIGELLRAVLELLWNRPDGLPAREILAFLPEITDLTEYEKGSTPASNTPRVERYIRLATIPLTQAGWLVKTDKGRWYLTDEGRAACRRYPGAQALYRDALQLYEETRQGEPARVAVLEEAQEKAWAQIQNYLLGTRRIEFQTLVIDLLIALGYHIVWIAPPEKDRGQVDLVVNVDPLGFKGPRIFVQIKQKGQPLTMEGLRTFISILGPDTHGLLISTGGFTNDVKERIRTDTLLKITLLDLEGFFDLWIEHYHQLSQEAHRRFPLKAVYFLHGIS